MIEDKNPQRTPLSKMGKFALIAHLDSILGRKNTLEDAVLVSTESETQILKSDIYIEGVHFDLSYMPLKHLGYKAFVSAIHGIAAMNGTATGMMVTVAVSNRFPLEALEELYAGFLHASKVYEVSILQHEVTSSNKGLIVSVQAIGKADKSETVNRGGAQATDLLVVTGDLGAAYMGLQVLEREKQVFAVNPNSQPDLDNYSYLIERQLKPEARTDIKGLLAALEVKPTAMIGITDGLASELIHLCKESDLGCHLYEDKLPLDPQFMNVCEEFSIDATTVAINGGEDYELLFTIPVTDFDKIKGNPNLSIVGHMTDKSLGMQLITRANTQIALKAKGWNME